LQYREALSWIHSRERFGMNQGLQRIEALLGYLGDPHKKLNFLHIGGSNGKGSTAALAASVLQSAGYQVGLYTSPYLEQFTDRMSVNGKEIPREHLIELVSVVRPLTEKIGKDSSLGQPTEFEVVTAIAFAFFAEVKPDLVVLEVGLGGRLDATNVVSPLVSVITTVSLEHTQVLGNTVESIAFEKAGIIKNKTDVVTQVTGGALTVIKEICREKNAHLYSLGRDFRGEMVYGDLDGQIFHYHGMTREIASLKIPLLGEYQINNASVALAALELLDKKGFTLPEEAFRRGLQAVRWPGRLEILGRDPLVVIDGAHNLEAFQGLRQALTQVFSYRKLILVLGILADKAMEDILLEIVPPADKLVITRPNSPRAAEPADLGRIVRAVSKKPVFIEEKIASALERAFSLASPEDMVLIAGSLYLVSEARQILQEVIIR